MAFLAKLAARGAARSMMKGDAGGFASIERAESIEKIKKKVLENIELKRMSINDLDNKLLNKLGGEEGIKKYLKESKSLDVARSNFNAESNEKRDIVEKNSLKSTDGTLDVSKSMYYNRENIEKDLREQKKDIDGRKNKEFEEGSEKNLKDLDQNLGQVGNDFGGRIGRDFRESEKNTKNNVDGLENNTEQKIDYLGKDESKLDGEDGSSLESKFFHTKTKHFAKNHDKLVNDDVNKISNNQIITDFDRSSNFNTPGNFGHPGNQRLNRNLANQNAARRASFQSSSFSQTSTGGQNVATGGGSKSGFSRRTGSYDPTRGQRSESWIKNTFDPFRKGYDNTAILRDGLSSINDQAKQVNGPIDFLMEFAMRKAKESGIDVPDEGIANNNANNNNNSGMSSVDDIFMKKTENGQNKNLEHSSGRSGLEYRGNSKTSLVEHSLAGKTAMVEHHPERKMSLGEHNLAGKTAVVEHHPERKAEIEGRQLERKVEIGEHQIASKIAMIENQLERKTKENRLEKKTEIEERNLVRKAEIEENRLERKAEIEERNLAGKAEIEERNLVGKAEIEERNLAGKAEIEENRLEKRAEIEENRFEKRAEIEENRFEKRAEIEENRLEKRAEIEENRLEKRAEIEENRLEKKIEIEERNLEKKAEIEEYNPGLPKVEGREHNTSMKALESEDEDTSQRNATSSDQTSRNSLKEGDAAQWKEEYDNVQKNLDRDNIEKTKLEFIDSFDIRKLPEDVHETARNLAERTYKDIQARNANINEYQEQIREKLKDENFRGNLIKVLRQERAMIEAEKNLGY